MKANELRINNWYKSVKFGVPVQCDLSDLMELCHRSDGAYNDPPIDEMFDPIPLAEEWLLKFGFVYDHDEEELILDDKLGVSFMCAHDSIIYYRGNLEPLWVDVLLNVEHVHQLQNLYFALCGKELIIK